MPNQWPPALDRGTKERTSSRPYAPVVFIVSRPLDQLTLQSVLHTCTQIMEFHPHVHCVPAGGLSFDHQRWVPLKSPLSLLSAEVGDPKSFLGEEVEKVFDLTRVQILVALRYAAHVASHLPSAVEKVS